MGWERPRIERAYAMAQRYQLGLNIALPADWAMQVYFSHTKDKEYFNNNNDVIKQAVSAALGWTIPATPAGGTTPAIATWTKPSNVPYLNLFCDPTAYRCNSDTTLDYLSGIAETTEYMHIRERGIKADGPLFDLPGGTVKMAVGANYTTYNFLIQQTQTNPTNPTVSITQDPRTREVWAGFAQLNVPIFSDQNSLPLLRRLEFEASWRHDQYNDVGGTSNAKLAFNWNPIESFTIRGGWGQSFRAPNFGEFSPVSNVAWQGWNFGQLYSQNTVPITIACAGGAPPAGSGADKFYQAGLPCDAGLGGISLNGGGKVAVDTGMRDYFNLEQRVLDPEKSVNWSVGFDYTPTGFLTGLNLQATYYIVKINGILRNFGNPGTSRFNDPSIGFAYVTPEDLVDPVSGTPLCAGQNATPWLCAPFQEVVAKVLGHPEIEVPSELQTLVYWINDGGVMNVGWQRTTGIDWQASYDWEWGNLGAFNAGITGTYYLSQESQVPGGVIDDFYHTTFGTLNGVEQVGVESRPRLKYRTRLGWSDGTWSVTGFMDYEQHFFHTQAAPPNVNFACITPGGTVGGLPNYTNPCWVSDYTNFMPSYYTFDLSVGYDTGDRPANEYLRNISIQLVVQNITDKHATLPVPDHHRRRKSVRVRHHQEPLRPRDIGAIAEDVLEETIRRRSSMGDGGWAKPIANERAAIHFGSQPFRVIECSKALPLLGDDERDGASLEAAQDIAGTRVAAAGADAIAVGRSPIHDVLHHKLDADVAEILVRRPVHACCNPATDRTCSRTEGCWCSR